MILRVEVRVDGKIIRVEEVEVDKEESTKMWDFLSRAKEMIGKLNPAAFIY